MKEKFTVAFGAGNRRVDDLDAGSVEFLNADADPIDGDLVGRGVADDAAFADMLAAGFKLGLDQDDGLEGVRGASLGG